TSPAGELKSISTYDLPTHMVSHPQPTDHALTTRRPASVTSRSTTTRRHRSSRSQTGSASFRPQNEFPNFAQTGDLEIIINAEGQEKRYMLHRLILAQCSGFFEASTSEDWSRAQAQGIASTAGPAQSTGLAKIGEDDEYGRESDRSTLPVAPPRDRYRWRYELDWGNKDDELPMLVQKPATSSLFGGDQTYRPPAAPTKSTTTASNGFFRSFTAMQSAAHIPHQAPDNDLIRDYDNLFRVFYNYPPNLDPLNIAESYIQCKSLLNLADIYDALEVVGPRIDHHLLQFQSRLWKQIAKYPPSYLKLGYLARSRVIFSEALIHVVGQWPAGSNQLRNHVPEAVFDLIEDKAEELAEKQLKTEGKLFRLTLTTPRGERVTPTNSYMDWLALSVFRQWVIENTSPPPPLPPKTPNSNQPSLRTQQQNKPSISPGHLYRLLYSAGPAYLPHDELKKFLKTSKAFGAESSGNPEYRREELKKFERRVDEVKMMAKEIVRPLMKSYLELDLGRDAAGTGVGLGQSKVPISIGESLLENGRRSEQRSATVQWNYKPTFRPHQTARIRSSRRPSKSHVGLTVKNRAEDGEYKYAGAQQASGACALVYNPSTKVLVLEKLDVDFTFNLQSSPSNHDRNDITSQFPQLDAGGSEDGSEDGTRIEPAINGADFTEPDMNNPYDYRHFLKRRRTSSPDAPLSRPSDSPAAPPRRPSRTSTNTKPKPRPRPIQRSKKPPPREEAKQNGDDSDDGGLTIEMGDDPRPRRFGHGAVVFNHDKRNGPISLRSAASSMSPASIRHESGNEDMESDKDVELLQLPSPAGGNNRYDEGDEDGDDDDDGVVDDLIEAMESQEEEEEARAVDRAVESQPIRRTIEESSDESEEE
ncbi:MAG: hypothetical protein Q9226_007657, partial [Calogaya cf. arnoldii]